MTAKIVLMIFLGFFIAPAGEAAGQEQPDLVGKWTFTVTGLPDDPRCGATSGGGEMQVTRKVTARAYRGSIRMYRTAERCGVTSIGVSALTVRVRDNDVSIDYDEEGWAANSLVLDGAVMTGTNEDGVVTEWIKQDAIQDQANIASEADMAKLEEYLASVGPDITERLRDYYNERLQKGLEKTGLNEEQAREITEGTIQRMLSCMLDLVRDDFEVEGLSFQEYLRNSRVSLLINPRAVDFRGIECVQDAGQNAGVTIR